MAAESGTGHHDEVDYSDWFDDDPADLPVAAPSECAETSTRHCSVHGPDWWWAE